MAGRGPAPKANPARRNKPEPVLSIAPDEDVRGAELPEGFEWPPQTVAWWETWRRSAQAQTFTDTDWSFLLDTAVMHAEFWLGNRALAAELRLRVAKFGATPEDRARLRINIGDPKGKPAAKLQQSPQTTDRRARLLKAVGDGGDH